MDNRLNPRVPVEPQCRARLRLDTGPLLDLPVVNLGTGGCCLDVPTPLAAALLGRLSVGDLELVHPGVPPGTLRGRIAWAHDRKAAGRHSMGVGIQFTATPPGFRQDLAGLVEKGAEYERRNPPFGGMPA